MRKSWLGKIAEQGVATSVSQKQIKITAKKSFLFFCLILSLTAGQLCPAVFYVHAEAVGPLPEGFNDIDLSDILITFPSGAGAGISNETVLNDLYNNYGVSGWGVADMTPYFDIVVSSTGESAGLSNNVLNEHLGDNQWFEQNGYDIKVNYDNFKEKLDQTETLTQYGANYIHQATLSPSTGNPWEWDWSEILEEYFRTGLIGFEHLFIDFDTLNGIAVTMDDVLRNIYDFWTPNIENGLPINASISMPSGYHNVSTGKTNENRDVYVYYNYSDGLYTGYLKDGSSYNWVMINTSSSMKSFNYKWYRPDGSFYGEWTKNVNAGSYYSFGRYISGSTDLGYFETGMAISQKIADIRGGETPEIDKSSPDLVNPENGSFSMNNKNDLSPSIETGYAIRPIPQDAYNNWVLTNNLSDAAEKGALMGALVAPYIEAEPAPAPSPAPDDPWADPVPDTEPANRPVSPNQPDFPEEPELTDEQINESLLGATPDLTEIFPFCIPWDIARILKHFTASRRAPYIEWTFESDLFGFSYTFEIDMAIFDDVATILRLLELAGFIIGLAILTRYLIGAS